MFGRLVLVPCLLVGSAVADPAPPKIDDAIKQAAASGKSLVVEFSTSWCHACEVFEKTTFPTAPVQAALTGVVFVRYDAEQAPGDEAARRYRIRSFPTFLAVDERGVERARQVGAVDGPSFVTWVGRARSVAESEAGMLRQLAAKPRDPAVALAAARWYSTRERQREALAQLDAVARNPSAPPVMRAEATRTAQHVRRIDTWKRTFLADTIANIQRDPARATADELAIATIGAGTDAKLTRALVAATLAAATDAGELNSLIYVAIAAGVHDEAIRGGARLLVMKRTPGYLDTVAEAHYTAGDRKQALVLADEALALAAGGTMTAGLAKNRARFANGSGDADEVRKLRARTAELWKNLATSDQLDARAHDTVTETVPIVDQREQRQIAFRKELDAAGKLLATTCRKDAGKQRQAYVRLVLGSNNTIVKSAILLEDSAPKQLRRCLTSALERVVIAGVPAGTVSTSLVVDF